MTFTLRGRTLRRAGVVGCGQIGPDIALHLARTLSPHRVPVVVVDVAEAALEAGRRRAEAKLAKMRDGESVREGLRFTTDHAELAGADLVIEAATEDLQVKRRIVEGLEATCAPGAILASNSSHMEPGTIFEGAADPSRGLVAHYFFPAERNPVVEVVPGPRTEASVVAWLLEFYEAAGKVPIRVGSRYGYAIDPIFEGIFQAATLLVEAGAGTTRQVDAMVREALGMGVGPFTAMNLTGGNPITHHGLARMGEVLSGWFRPPRLLAHQMEQGGPWDVAGRGEAVDYSAEQLTKVREAITGTYLGLVGQVLDSGITCVADLEMALELALVVRAPFEWMNAVGSREALRLVEAWAAASPGFEVPECLRARAESGERWEVPMVLRRDVDGVAVLTLRRPRVLGALSTEVLRQLAVHCEAVEAGPGVLGAVITGFGVKAFAAGADVGELAGLRTPAEAEAHSRNFQRALDRIEAMRKPVVAALNGVALGGGAELAMACHERIARKGLDPLLGQPEVRLGLIPGAGGTQRLPRLIGLEAASRLLRTGGSLSGAEALRHGLVSEEVEGALVDRAVERVRRAAARGRPLSRIPTGPLPSVPGRLPEVDLAHLSRAVDAILCETVLAGARLPLREGLALESRAFGRCTATEDARIGLENFRLNGPRQEARFVHR